MIVAVCAWAGWAGAEAAAAVSAARSARHQLTAVRDRPAGDLLTPGPARAARHAARSLDIAARHARSPALAPVRVLPLVGRQVDSFASLAAATATATRAAEAALTSARRLATSDLPLPQDRPARLDEMHRVASRARARLRALDPGPATWLAPPLAGAHRVFRREAAQLRRDLDRAAATTGSLADLLRGPRTYLLIAANNAEMRAGSGMFLQAGSLEFRDGQMTLHRLAPVWQHLPPPGAVVATGDMQARWGWLSPGDDYRNLALSPRFDRSAEMAAAMWAAAGQGAVDGVLAVDPVALREILAAAGPVEISGETIGAGNVVDDLLLRQYKLDLDWRGQQDRRDRLAAVTTATIKRLEAGGTDVRRFVEGLATAARGRHVLAWAASPDEQQLWRLLGVTGTLESRSLLVSVLNRGGGRGGGKLDRRLEASAAMTWRPTGSGTTVTVDLTLHNTVAPGERTYVESDVAGAVVDHGLYRGIVAVTLPGSARHAVIESRPLAAAGADGGNRLVATAVTIAAGDRLTLQITFDLPRNSRIRVEPSARVPAVRWKAGNDHWRDDAGRDITLTPLAKGTADP